VNGRFGLRASALKNFVALAIVAATLVGCSSETDGTTVSADDARDPGYSATDAEIIQTDADGQPRYRLQAARIEQNPVSLETRIEELRIETRTGDANVWRVSAPRGVLSRDSRLIDLEGGVALEGGAPGAAEPLRMHTSALQYDLGSLLVRTNGEVRLTIQGYELSATGLDTNLRTRQVQLRSNVQGRFSR